MGEHCDVRICDFSSARRETQDALLTQYMVTRWYRPPEILLCKEQYNTAVDLWSAGCIFAELIMPPSPHRRGLFPGATYKDQTDRIIEVRGRRRAACIAFEPPSHCGQMLGSPSDDDLSAVCSNR